MLLAARAADPAPEADITSLEKQLSDLRFD